ncbi:hypothetical protein [Klebsiella oxytoca]|uniref:hypothetical protein n=1 Tax=Klebsiella oxytoca TaxID=571 RepID=UPI00157A3CCB|nr:hypothetical protein [Klebsiella oxytoca]
MNNIVNCRNENAPWSWLLMAISGMSANGIKGSRATGKKAHQQRAKTTLQLAGEMKNMTKN